MVVRGKPYLIWVRSMRGDVTNTGTRSGSTFILRNTHSILSSTFLQRLGKLGWGTHSTFLVKGFNVNPGRYKVTHIMIQPRSNLIFGVVAFLYDMVFVKH